MIIFEGDIIPLNLHVFGVNATIVEVLGHVPYVKNLRTYVPIVIQAFRFITFRVMMVPSIKPAQTVGSIVALSLGHPHVLNPKYKDSLFLRVQALCAQQELEGIHVITIPHQKWTSPIVAKEQREYPIMKLQFSVISLTRMGTSEPCAITVGRETNFLIGGTKLSSLGRLQIVVCLCHRPR